MKRKTKLFLLVELHQSTRCTTADGGAWMKNWAMGYP